MKTIIRILAVALCIALLGVTLCSCQYLEDHKNNRAVFTDSSKESFTFRGYTYKKMEFPSKSNLMLMADGDTSAYVTTEDVPVLLTSMFGQPIVYNGDEKNPLIMTCHSNENEVFYGVANLGITYNSGSASPEGTYVREDKFDELKNTIVNAKLDHYYYWVFNEEYDEWNNYSAYYIVEVRHLAGDSLTKAINDTLENGKKVKYIDVPNDEGWSETEVYPCDKDMMVTNSRLYYIFTDGKDYYVIPTTSGDPDTDELIKADKKYYDLFKDLLSDEDIVLGSGLRISDYFET